MIGGLLIVAQNLQREISQCATDGFDSFLRRWIPPIERYPLVYLDLSYCCNGLCVRDIQLHESN